MYIEWPQGSLFLLSSRIQANFQASDLPTGDNDKRLFNIPLFSIYIFHIFPRQQMKKRRVTCEKSKFEFDLPMICKNVNFASSKLKESLQKNESFFVYFSALLPTYLLSFYNMRNRRKILSLRLSYSWFLLYCVLYIPCFKRLIVLSFYIWRVLWCWINSSNSNNDSNNSIACQINDIHFILSVM